MDQIVSKRFYDNEVVTAEQIKLSRTSSQPCKWVHVSGGEVKHKDRVRLQCADSARLEVVRFFAVSVHLCWSDFLSKYVVEFH